jgi:hypothetical protein
MRAPSLLLVALALAGCQSTPVMPVGEPGQRLEIWVFRCASEDALRYGDTGREEWGEGWHYVEKLLRCGRA